MTESKKITLLISLSIIMLIFSSCKQANVSDNNSTSRVLLKSNSSQSSFFEFIDQEGNVYKSGTVYSDETITINHFINSTYNLRTKDNAYNPGKSMNTLIITISKDCTITFGYGGSVNIQ